MLSRVSRRRIELPAARERDRLVFTRETDWQRQHLLDRTSDLPEDLFTPGRGRTLRIGGYVGIVDTGRLYIELLPRVSATGSATEDRQFLLDLLAESKMMPSPRRRDASIAMEGRRLLEIVIRSTAVRLLELLAEGAPRRYHPIEEKSATLRGRLNMRAMATRLPTEAHRFPIRHAPLQRNNHLSRLLSALSASLSEETRDPESRRLLTQSRNHVEAWTGPAHLDKALVDSVVLFPSESQWQPFVALASAIVRGRAPHPVEAGRSAGHGLIFSVDDLFERLLRVRFPALRSQTGLALQGVGRSYLLEDLQTGRSNVQLRPDYVFSSPDDAAVLVADAKWKVQASGEQLRVGRADAYQMTAYMLRHGSDRGLLLYPGEAGVERYSTYRVMPQGGTLHVGTIDVGGLVSTSRQVRSRAEEWLAELVRQAAGGGDGEAGRGSPEDGARPSNPG